MKISRELIIPCFAKAILQIGAMPEGLYANGRHGVEKLWRLPLDAPLPDPKDVGQGVQCILIAMQQVLPGIISGLLSKAEELARNPAQIVFFFSEPFECLQEAELDQLLAARGWLIYRSGQVDFGGEAIPTTSVIAVRGNYNPVAHARQMAGQGRPDCAVRILDAVPADLIDAAGLMEGLANERQRHYLHWQRLKSQLTPCGADSHQDDSISTREKTRPNVQPDQKEALLHLGLVRGEGYGWGVCSNYLIRELSRKRPVKVLKEADGTAPDPVLQGTLFQALINVDFDPMFPRTRGSRNIGYTFFENELTPTSVENAKAYDLVLGGSSWCRDRMLEKGIHNCDVLIQGIDPDLFYPVQPRRPGDRFIIFSGGKFELRKGQDLVLRAVKIMQDRYPDVWLMNCWFNLWPASARLMAYSRHIQFRFIEGETWQKTMNRTYLDNGLDPSRIITHDLVHQARQRELYAQTDIGVFPNRCEGGTNLVLMEYMACGKPVIASNVSGHRDILSTRNALLLNASSDLNVTDAQGTLTARWKDPSLDELVARLEYAYHHREALQALGKSAAEDLKRFTWSQSAARLIEFVDNIA